MHGYGITTWKSGSKYEGEYFKSYKHGFGKYTYPSGKVYVGSW